MTFDLFALLKDLEQFIKKTVFQLAALDKSSILTMHVYGCEITCYPGLPRGLCDFSKYIINNLIIIIVFLK